MAAKKLRFYGLFILSGLVVLAIGFPLRGQLTQPLPTPEDAIRQAEQLNPEQLPVEVTRLDIDEATRDRLRFDPAWQPILKAVQQDIMILKWGNSQLENPVWQQYGAKAYPLLDYYTRTNDPTRQAYGMLGIRSLGKPYTTLWLERQIQRRSPNPDFYLLTASTRALLSPENADYSQEEYWQQIFGLNDPATRDRLVQLARQNLEPDTSPTYYDQFNLDFLTNVLGDEAVLPQQPSPFDPKPAPVIPEWDQFEKANQASPAEVQAAVIYYRSLPQETRDYILVNRLGQVKAGEISAFGKGFLQALANDSEAIDRVWAMAELDRHGDLQGSQLLQRMLNGNLEELYPLTDSVRYADGFFREGTDKATHAYYLLVGIAEKYPESRFVRAAREYGNLRGQSYWGGEPRSLAKLAQIAQRTPAQRTTSWQSWLDRYPDHPGTDDATYLIARGWQDQNQIMAAFDLWVQLITQRVGDGDAKYLAWPHMRTLLDVGLSLEQMEKLPELYRSTTIAPLFRYALAVRYARMQDYSRALQTSEGLDLTAMPEKVLGSYYNERFIGSYYGQQQTQENQVAIVQQQMQTLLTEQRQRWQRLQQLQAENTPESRYQIASTWAGEGGWKNGYLGVWDNARSYTLPTGDWGNTFCDAFWVCNTTLRGETPVRESYQQSSQNAIVLSLYQSLFNDPATPPNLRESSLQMKAATLLRQWEDYPLSETFRIHPVVGIVSSSLSPHPSMASYEAWEAKYSQIEKDYINTISQIITTLQQQFPKNNSIDDLLFSRYALSGDVSNLQEIVTKYPESDRVAEAKFLLTNRRSNASGSR